jgi:hypothetical protein
MLKKEKKLVCKLLFLTMSTSLMLNTIAFAKEKDTTGEVVTNQFQVIDKAANTNKETDFRFDAKTGTILGYLGTSTTVVIPSTINGVSVTNIGHEAFYDRYDLKSVVIPDSVTNIEEEAFTECASLTNIQIGKNVTSIKTNAFSGCIRLTSISIPDSVKDIEDYAFYGCEELRNVEIGKGINHIGYDAFLYCKNAVYYVHNEAAVQLLINAGADNNKIILN